MDEYQAPVQGSFYQNGNASQLQTMRKQRREVERSKTEGLEAAPNTYLTVHLAGTICKKNYASMIKLLKANGIETKPFLSRDQAIEYVLADDLLRLKVKASLSIKPTKAAIIAEMAARQIVFNGCPEYGVSTEL